MKVSNLKRSDHMRDLYRIERYVCSRGDDVQRSIELLDKVLSEYDEHEAEGEGGGGVGVGSGGGGGGGGDGSGGGSGGGVGDCGSSTEPSIGLTPDDESPSLGIFYPLFSSPSLLPSTSTPFLSYFIPSFSSFVLSIFSIVSITCSFIFVFSKFRKLLVFPAPFPVPYTIILLFEILFIISDDSPRVSSVTFFNYHNDCK